MINENYFSEINTDLKAYFLGFFIADGSVSVNDKRRCYGRFSFLIQENDSYLLEKLASELGDCKVVDHNYCYEIKNRKSQRQLRWTSRKMFNDLKKYNLACVKTFTDFNFPFEKVPEQYWGALIRGFIDGDGSFEQNKGTFNPVIVGPNKTWIKQVGDLVNSKTGLVYKIYEKHGKTCNWYFLRWSANRINKVQKIQKLYNFLYDGAEIYLKRKKDKIEAYLEYRANQTRVKGVWRCNA